MKQANHQKDPESRIAVRKELILKLVREIIGGGDTCDHLPLFDDIPLPVQKNYESVLKHCLKFCDSRPDLPIREGLLQLLNLFSRMDTDPPPFSWGHLEIWAGGIIYASCQIIGITRKTSGLYVTTDEVAAFCHTGKYSIRNKALDIRHEVTFLKQQSEKGNQSGDFKDFFSPDWAERFSSWASNDDPNLHPEKEGLTVTPLPSLGTCFICNEKIKGALFEEHLESCLQKTGWPQSGEPGLLIRVMGTNNRRYWLMVLAGPETTLSDLDRLIRGVWVECCGHLSAFSIGNTSFNSDGEGEGMNVYIRDVLVAGDTCSYRYDFGSSTRLSVIALRPVKMFPLIDGLVLLGQNCRVHRKCSACGTEATMCCQEPWDEEELDEKQCNKKPLYFCDACAETSSYDSEWMERIGNSPRNGVCGCNRSDENGVYWHPDKLTERNKAGKKHKRPEVRRYRRADLYANRYPRPIR
ncbi:MAG: DUF6398 domain-containing protein [Methanoregula sp.]|nr:DUF6398 domain-containing protein [Methanoregula sp.]